MSRAVEARARAILLEYRRQTLAGMGGRDREIDAAFEGAASRIRARIRAEGATIADLNRIIGEELSRAGSDVVNLTRAGIQQGINDGVAGASATATRVVAPTITNARIANTVAAALLSPEAQAAANREAFQEASAAIRQRQVVRSVPVSERVRRNLDATRAGMTEQIQASVRAGESIQVTAERLMELDTASVQVPQYVTDLAEAARRAAREADVTIFQDVVAKYESQLNALGQGATRADGAYSLRSASRQLVHELEGAKLEAIDSIVDRWTLDKARYQARQIARTETVEAYRQGYIAKTKDEPYTVGYRWTTSGSHPHADVCDVLAGQDLYGLGPGGYPPNEIPQTPHPNCLCQTTQIIDEHWQERELAQLDGTPEPPRPWESGQRVTGQEWLAAQPVDRQRALLGPTRQAALANGQRVLSAGGVPRPVYEVTGQPKPTRSRVTTSPSRVIAADRASMVRQRPATPRP